MRTMDTLVMGWGKVSDITSSENQLIIGAFSLTNVSVYVMDLRKIQPFDSWLKQSSMIRTPGNESLYEDICSDLDDDNSQIIGRQEYLDSVHCIDNSSINSDLDFSKTQVLGVDLSTFLPPLDEHYPGEIKGANPFNCTYKITSVQGKPAMLALPTAVTHPYNYEKDVASESSVDIAEQSMLPSRQKESLRNSHSLSFPDLGQKCEMELVQQARSKSLGIELEDFLPRGFLGSDNCGYSSLEISDSEAISSIYRGHDSMTNVLNHRKKYLQSVIRIWKTDG
ncbi:hypothetical protein X975_09629, partial [Stegodyphus mimosarum]